MGIFTLGKDERQFVDPNKSPWGIRMMYIRGAFPRALGWPPLGTFEFPTLTTESQTLVTEPVSSSSFGDEAFSFPEIGMSVEVTTF